MEEVRKELEAIERERGIIEPAVVVAAARDPDSALHEFFEWDDSKAADAHRIQQARQLIARIKVQMVGGDQQTYNVRSFAHLSSDRRGYRSLETISAEQSLADTLRADLARDLQRLIAKYRSTLAVINEPELFRSMDAYVAGLLSQPDMRKAS